jgi:hypothetical protein
LKKIQRLSFISSSSSCFLFWWKWSCCLSWFLKKIRTNWMMLVHAVTEDWFDYPIISISFCTLCDVSWPWVVSYCCGFSGWFFSFRLNSLFFFVKFFENKWNIAGISFAFINKKNVEHSRFGTHSYLITRNRITFHVNHVNVFISVRSKDLKG